jgi:nitrite reductase (NADH) large subunit
VADRDEALRLATAFLQFYRENADYKERTYDFVPRVGLDEVRQVVLDPELSAGLIERFRIAKAAAIADPWRERDEPYHPRQFADLDDPDPEEVDLRELAAVGPPPGGRR